MSDLVGDFEPKLLSDNDVPDAAQPLVEINLKIFCLPQQLFLSFITNFELSGNFYRIPVKFLHDIGDHGGNFLLETFFKIRLLTHREAKTLPCSE